jgi:UDP-N-acetylmuramoyl-tripeptide--D-alanyl-D-alanine ligase
MTKEPLWTTDAMAEAMRATPASVLPNVVDGISIDSRTIRPGEAFFAISGDNRDGHDFVAAALNAGAAFAVVSKSTGIPDSAPLLLVDDVLEALRALARAARTRSRAKIVAVTGSVGKTGTKEALQLTLGACGEAYASTASYNNHWGVPLSLARCPASTSYAVFEIGMNHAGEIEPLTKLVRPHVAIITTVEPVHLEFFDSIEAIADAKAEIFLGLERDGAAVLNRDNPHFDRLRRSAEKLSVERIVSFGEHPKSDSRLLAARLLSDCSIVQACICGSDVTYKLGAPGRHLVFNSLAVLTAASLLDADLALAALALSEWKPASGRGARQKLDVPGGAALLIDESYNANPASMRAALALLGTADVGPRGRRIAVLGDMLELGEQGAALHRALTDCVLQNGVDIVFCCGPLMRSLWEALPSDRRGGYAETAQALEGSLLAAVGPGDAIMVKGSLGSRMGPIVNALRRQFSTETLSNPPMDSGLPRSSHVSISTG